ncbi:putative gustatory receptor 28a isoform X1 [Megalopta genalis]|uniref:putative gustatory receptor 28a isoform X1 n=1 Tax=Megalopta genalis TaxID=115081 RepID=UPI003FD0644A
MAYPPRWIYRAVLWFHIIFKIMGLSPVSLRDKDPKTSSAIFFGRSNFGIFYNALLSISLVASSFVTLPRLHDEAYGSESTVTYTIEMVQSTYGTLMISTILLCYIYKWSSLRSICNSLMHLEEQFRFSREPISIYRTFWILLMVYVGQTIMCVGVVVTEELAFHDGPLGWVVSVLPTAFVANILFQYFSVISLMTMNFIRVNEALQSLHRSTSIDSKSLNRRRRASVNCSMPQSLRHLRNIYDNLCEASEEISQFYSFPTLLVVPFVFCSLVFNLYYLLLLLFDDDTYFELFSFINGVFFIVYLTYPLGILTGKITDILDKIERTGIIVYSLLNNAIDEETLAEVKSHRHRQLPSKRVLRFFQLRQFALQLLHRQIKFTTSDYFNLDNALFQSVVSSVITYLVILIQFQVANKSSIACQCNCTMD